MYHINNINGFEAEPGKVHIIPGEQINEEEKSLLEVVSVISFDASSDAGLSEQAYAATNSILEKS